MYKIFQNNIKQLNLGDVQGTLVNSFNCDTTFNRGKMSIAQRTRITTDSLTDMGTPVGFTFFDGYWWTVAGKRVFKGLYPQSQFEQDNSNSGTYLTPANCDSNFSDILVFNNNLIVSNGSGSDSRIYRKVANGSGTGGWESIALSLPTLVARSMCVFAGRLYWVNNRNTIHSCDTSWTIKTTSDDSQNLTIENNQIISFLKPHANGIFIGTITEDGTQGQVIDWNGETKNIVRNKYNIYAQGVLSAYVDNSRIYAMNSNGVLLRFNGSFFEEVARFPIKRDSLYNANSTGSSGNDRFIHPNGLKLIDNKISLLINGKSNSTNFQDINIPSGIWEYDEMTGSFYHKYSASYNTIGGNQTDTGQFRIAHVGGLADTPDTLNISNGFKGNFLAGMSFFKDSSLTEYYGIFSDNYYDDEYKTGWFTTVQLRASNYEDMWNNVTSLYTPTNNIKYVVKYRNITEDESDINITWINSTTFTTTSTGLEQGDEITIISGKGGGMVSHIVGTPSFSSPNFTVILDENHINATGTAIARVQKWKKIGDITKTNQFFKELFINKPSTTIQIKIFMTAIGEATIDEIIIENKINK